MNACYLKEHERMNLKERKKTNFATKNCIQKKNVVQRFLEAETNGVVGVFIVSFEHISHLALEFLLLTLSR